MNDAEMARAAMVLVIVALLWRVPPSAPAHQCGGCGFVPADAGGWVPLNPARGAGFSYSRARGVGGTKGGSQIVKRTGPHNRSGNLRIFSALRVMVDLHPKPDVSRNNARALRTFYDQMGIAPETTGRAIALLGRSRESH